MQGLLGAAAALLAAGCIDFDRFDSTDAYCEAPDRPGCAGPPAGDGGADAGADGGSDGGADAGPQLTRYGVSKLEALGLAGEQRARGVATGFDGGYLLGADFVARAGMGRLQFTQGSTSRGALVAHYTVEGFPDRALGLEFAGQPADAGEVLTGVLSTGAGFQAFGPAPAGVTVRGITPFTAVNWQCPAVTSSCTTPGGPRSGYVVQSDPAMESVRCDLLSAPGAADLGAECSRLTPRAGAVTPAGQTLVVGEFTGPVRLGPTAATSERFDACGSGAESTPCPFVTALATDKLSAWSVVGTGSCSARAVGVAATSAYVAVAFVVQQACPLSYPPAQGSTVRTDTGGFGAPPRENALKVLLLDAAGRQVPNGVAVFDVSMDPDAPFRMVAQGDRVGMAGTALLGTQPRRRAFTALLQVRPNEQFPLATSRTLAGAPGTSEEAEAHGVTFSGTAGLHVAGHFRGALELPASDGGRPLRFAPGTSAPHAFLVRVEADGGVSAADLLVSDPGPEQLPAFGAEARGLLAREGGGLLLVGTLQGRVTTSDGGTAVTSTTGETLSDFLVGHVAPPPP
jgi:hypothetical protein